MIAHQSALIVEKMRVVTLIENHSENELACEHGLAFYIEYNEKAYLLDAGQSDLFIKNAEALNIDLSTVQKAVLSHAHYDHAGGLGAFVEKNNTAQIYMQKTAQQECFSEKEDGVKNIGIPKNVRMAIKERVRYVEGDYKLDEGVYLIAHHTEGLCERGKQMHMYREDGGIKCYDDFSHEQSLVFDLKSGLVVFNSCSHGGVDVVLEEVQKVFGDRQILAMFGGFHLMGSAGPESMRESREQVRALAEKLAGMKVNVLYTGHCTGTEAFSIMKEVLGVKLMSLVSGADVDIF